MKAAVYSRKSKFTGRGESIENQVGLCRQYIHQHFPADAEQEISVYEDEGFSGGNTDRPQFKQMMADARAKRFSVLVCYRLDRISRNIGDFAKLIEELNALSISFLSIREQFDTGSPMGRAMMYIASVFSQLERETTAERIRDNMRELAKTGRWLGGTAPTGYESRPVETVSAGGKKRRAFQLVFRDGEIGTARLIYRKFLETGSLTQVETYLIQNHILSRTGKRYTRFTIRGLLENPVYLTADREAWRYFHDAGVELCAEETDFDGKHGIMAYNKTLQQRGRKNRVKEMSNWIVAVGRHRGILSGADWIHVQEMLNQNRCKSYRKPKSHTALLSGLLRCGRCGSYLRPKLTQRENGQGERVYAYLCELKEKSRGQNCSICNVNGNQLDRAVCDEVKKLPEDRTFLIKTLLAARKLLEDGPEETGAELGRLNRSIRENEQAVAGLVSALARAAESAVCDTILREISEREKNGVRLEARRKELLKATEPQPLSAGQAENIKNMLCSFPAVFDAMTAEEKRDALRVLLDRVVWNGETAVLRFSAGSRKDAGIPQCEDSK